MEPRHLISIEDVTREWWDELYGLCRGIIERPGDYMDACRGKVMASMFYEPSTRTSFSFQAAMQRLGGSVFGFSDPTMTSSAKGETLADTVRVAGAYADTIVIRSPYEGAAFASSLYSPVPVINAGDGGHFHPTQTLTDLTAIAQKRGGLSNFTIGLCGDLKYGRTVHSLVSALTKFPGISYVLIAPDELKMPEYALSYIVRAGQKYREVESLEDTLPELDILYMTRIQRERIIIPDDYRRLRGSYVLTRKMLDERARADLLVLHPLPRLDEISPDVDDDPRAKYFDQVRCGMFIRMALLLRFCGVERQAPAKLPSANAPPCRNPSCITKTETYLPRIASTTTPTACAYCDTPLTR